MEQTHISSNYHNLCDRLPVDVDTACDASKIYIKGLNKAINSGIVKASRLNTVGCDLSNKSKYYVSKGYHLIPSIVWQAAESQWNMDHNL